MTTELEPSIARFADFAEGLSDLMHDRRITRADLAGHLGVSQAAVGKYLRGETLPGAENLKRIAEVLGVSLAELLGPAPARRPRRPQAFALISGQDSADGDLRRVVEREVEARLRGLVHDAVDEVIPTIVEAIRKRLEGESGK